MAMSVKWELTEVNIWAYIYSMNPEMIVVAIYS